VALARETGAHFHVYHVSTGKELDLFDGDVPLAEKKITAEACVHHLWFSDADYAELGNRIKWNPAVKTTADRDALRAALLDGRIDVVATDHAPHTLEEKQRSYIDAPSGGPLIQNSLPAMLELARRLDIDYARIVELMCHQPAQLFGIEERGFLREGYRADVVSVDPNRPYTVHGSEMFTKCKWSPFEGRTFAARISQTWVNGTVVIPRRQAPQRSGWAATSFQPRMVGARIWTLALAISLSLAGCGEGAEPENPSARPKVPDSARSIHRPPYRNAPH